MTIKRLNYFTGQFLREEDFNDEQGYHLTMRRTHNRRAHTPGIVDGLTVLAATNQVMVSAGLAIDPSGREIILDAAMAVPVAAGDVDAFVVMALDEKKTDTKAETGISGETRWSESPLLTLASSVPAGAVGLAQIAAVAGDGTVTLNGDYRRIYSAPALAGDLSVGRDLTAHGNVAVSGDIVVSGKVDGRDLSSDGSKLDAHAADSANPHATTAAQVDTQGGSNRLVTQINASSGIIAEARIESSIARETRFNTASGHDHDGSDSKKISPSSLEGASASVTADNLNVLTAGSTSDAATLHTHTVLPALAGELTVPGNLTVVKNIVVSGTVDGRDLSSDGSKLDTHAADSANPHATTAAQVDTQGGSNRLVTQINTSSGTIAEARIESTIARETRFNTASGHDHDGSDSKKISPSSLEGVSARVTAANLNVLTAGPTSDAAALHTHPFVPDDGSVTLKKLDPATRARMLRVPLLAQSLNVNVAQAIRLSQLFGSAFDGTCLWVADSPSGVVLKIDPASNVVVATVEVGYYPRPLAFGGGYLWVANWNNIVKQIDVATNTVVATIRVESASLALAISGDSLWVANFYADSVSRIDMVTHTITATVPVGSRPLGLAVVGSFLWVANSGSNGVSKIDMASNTVVATVSVGSQPVALAAATATFLWVANAGDITVSKVDVGANTVAATLPVDMNPFAIAVIGTFVWVGGWQEVKKIDPVTNAVVATVGAQVGYYGNGMVNAGGFLWVSGDLQMKKIDVTAHTVAATVWPAESRGMAFDGLYLWVALYGSDRILKVDIDTLQIVQTVPVGTRPHSVACNGSHLFVTNYGSNSVSKIDPLTGEVVASIAVGANPAGIAYHSSYQTLWVANSGDGTISVFYDYDTSVARTHQVGTNPQGVACDRYSVWVTSTGSNMVTRLGAWIDGGVELTLSVAAAPQTIVFDNYRLWVAHAATNTLSTIYSDTAILTTVALPTGAQPTKMCFNGTHLLVQCSDGQLYRIDPYTQTVLAIPVWGRLGSGWVSGVLAFDGVNTWAVEDGTLYRAPV
ncbi:MAG: hypothetical protein V5B33_18605 [Candidatus Accumulibacter sp. UW20]|jgi:YVTN family beta-propeller protein